MSSVFKLYLFILETYVDTVNDLYHSHYANEIKSYQGIILRRIVNTYKTLNQIMEVSQDPFSGYSLLRTIADSICTYCFIYDNDNSDEVEFRHFLFLLDGCSQFVNKFHLVINKNELIEEKERNNIEIQFEQEKSDINDFHQRLLVFLQNTHIVMKFPSETESIIRNRDWKYRTIISYSRKKSYSWQDIYKKAGCDVFSANFLSAYLSQYVHGLFLSNSKNPDTKVHYPLIYDFATSLEQRLISAILNCYKEDNIEKIFFSNIDLGKMHESDIDIEKIISYFNRKRHTIR